MSVRTAQSYELKGELEASERERELKERLFWPVHFYYDLLLRGLRRYHSVRTCHATVDYSYVSPTCELLVHASNTPGAANSEFPVPELEARERLRTSALSAFEAFTCDRASRYSRCNREEWRH